MFADPKVLGWFTVQARTRALLNWAADPRREAQVPGMLVDVMVGTVPHSFDAGVHTELEADGDTMRVVVHIRPYMLHPDWAVPAHAATWLLEIVDGPVAGSMQTIPRPSADATPPEKIAVYPRVKINKKDPAGGPPLTHYLLKLDPINGVAQYSTSPSTTCPTCGRASHNPTDVAERYCGACHMYYTDMPSGR